MSVENKKLLLDQLAAEYPLPLTRRNILGGVTTTRPTVLKFCIKLFAWTTRDLIVPIHILRHDNLQLIEDPGKVLFCLSFYCCWISCCNWTRALGHKEEEDLFCLKISPDTLQKYRRSWWSLNENVKRWILEAYNDQRWWLRGDAKVFYAFAPFKLFILYSREVILEAVVEERSLPGEEDKIEDRHIVEILHFYDKVLTARKNGYFAKLVSVSFVGILYGQIWNVFWESFRPSDVESLPDSFMATYLGEVVPRNALFLMLPWLPVVYIYINVAYRVQCCTKITLERENVDKFASYLENGSNKGQLNLKLVEPPTTLESIFLMEITVIRLLARGMLFSAACLHSFGAVVSVVTLMILFENTSAYMLHRNSDRNKNWRRFIGASFVNLLTTYGDYTCCRATLKAEPPSRRRWCTLGIPHWMWRTLLVDVTSWMAYILAMQEHSMDFLQDGINLESLSTLISSVLPEELSENSS